MAAYYLYEKPWSYDYWSCRPGTCVCGVNFEFDLIIEENALMLVKVEIVGNRYHFSLLGNKTLYENLNIPVGTWDNVFVPFNRDKHHIELYQDE